MAQHPKVGIIMGSRSDWPTMKRAADVLTELGVEHEARVVSAHRTPERLYEYARTAKARGLKVIIAGAGGAAHLPGMTAAMTTLPVLGVPVVSEALSGQDSLLSIVQMPAGSARQADGGRARDPPRRCLRERRACRCRPAPPSASWAAASSGAC
jgi:5-(carboxyamino)imidazole ribonucleotide mutase